MSKPFRFNNSWFKHEGFSFFIKEDWVKIKVEGRGDFIVYEKLKCLKSCIREWNSDILGQIDLKVSDQVKNLNDLDFLLIDNLGGDTNDLVKY